MIISGIYFQKRGSNMTENDDKKLVVPPTQENKQKCLCPDCPSYNQCMQDKGEVLFCSSGATSCELEKWGCPCVRCPVQLEYHNIGLFYCEKGALKK